MVEGWEPTALLLLKITLAHSYFFVFSDEAYNSTIDTMDNFIMVKVFYKLRNPYTILMKLVLANKIYFVNILKSEGSQEF